MTNPISSIFENLNDQELKDALLECQELERTGFLSEKSNLLHELCRQVKDHTYSTGMDLFMVTNCVQRQGALRWLKSQNL